MKKDRLKILSVIAIIIVATIHFKLEEFLKEQTIHHSGLISIIVAGVVGVVFLLVFDFLLEIGYTASGKLRYRLHKIYHEPYFEGWWVDVGIDQKAGIPEIVDYSFIAIITVGESLLLEGRSWSTHKRSVTNWKSIYVAVEGRSLHFKYEYTTIRPDSGINEGQQTARYHFGLDERSFDGYYDGDLFTAVGHLEKCNRAVGAHYPFPDDDEREKMAKSYMESYMRGYGYDRATFRQVSGQAMNLQRKDWFYSFLKQSDSKAREVDLLNKTLSSLPWTQPSQSILDLGPGDGTLTVTALSFSGGQLSEAKYVGVDSNGYLLEELKGRLLKDCRRIQGPNTAFVMVKIEDFLAQDKGQFDLILALHCFYFVEALDDNLSKVLTRSLAPGGRLIAMHTDITKAVLLNRLLKEFNPGLHRDVVQRIDTAASNAQSAGVRSVERLTDIVRLSFPQLSEQAWQKVKDNGSGEEVDKTIGLISFLLDKGPNDLGNQWAPCVEEVRKHLSSGGNAVTFPEVAQIFERREKGDRLNYERTGETF